MTVLTHHLKEFQVCMRAQKKLIRERPQCVREEEGKDVDKSLSRVFISIETH